MLGQRNGSELKKNPLFYKNFTHHEELGREGVANEGFLDVISRPITQYGRRYRRTRENR